MAQKTNLDDVWKDLLAWQTEINKKDETLNRRKLIHDQVLPPVQASTEILLDAAQPSGLDTLTVKKQSPSPRPNEKDPKTRAEKAETEKAMGNTYFGKKDYKAAISHYTKAIELDPTVPVYFVNRAMAHLKLNNFLEAEKDCTRGIQLQPKNVKALWRRGIARVELGRIEEARKDFEKGLAIEPNNKSLLDELKKLPTAKVAEKKAKSNKIEPTEEKRRLPINVIDESYKQEKEPAKTPAKAPAKESLKSPVKEPAEKKTMDHGKKEVKELAKKEVKETVKVEPKEPTKVPMKEADRSVTTAATPSIEPTVKKASEQPVPKKSTTSLTLSIPRSNFDFERDWKTCKGRGENELYTYFQMIPPALYVNIFKSSLESDQFEKMIELLETRYIKEKTSNDIFDVLAGLSQVKRIDMLVMFLGKKEQQALQKLFDFMKSSGDIPIEKLQKLTKIYGTHV